MSATEWEYLAGRDEYGDERWVVGKVERREQRDDGEWCWCVPAYRGSGVGMPEPMWVHADQVRPYERPTYGRRAGRCRR
ncbi:hypothetical protein [Actinopolymorpha alba]|uniref:hypothetical protein n=1 Tax=Actinopolymorpha alba TaxID=533267 RepID=UPI000380A90D|nr:hypothetical protein [Actinopolymorpha alba]